MSRSTMPWWQRMAWGAAVTITLAAFVLSLLPRVPMPEFQSGDKLVHASAYAALALCWRLALPSRVRSSWVLLGVFMLGAVIECLQGLTPWRQFEWADMLANGSGAALGLCLWWAAVHLLRRRTVSRT
jgi:VanZ family protein